VPPLRYLGDHDLMQVQPAISEPELASADVQQWLDTLKEAMHVYGGIGIAAPQIGWWARAMCFGINGSNPRYSTAPPVPFQYWINPEIVWSSSSTSWMWEGCLSVPGMRGWVERPDKVRMKGLDEEGNVQEVHLTGLPARIAQHELDHLDGVLFPQRVSEPRFLVPQKVFDAKGNWSKNWPSPGSYLTAAGALSADK